MEAIGMTVGTIITTSLVGLGAYLPQFLAGLILLLIGLVVATLLKEVVIRFLKILRVEEWFGGVGHLETLVAGFYLERTYKQKPQDIKDPQVWDEVAKYLGLGLCNSIVHWSPDIVVLGGAVMKSVDLQKVKTYLTKYLTIFPQTPEVVLAKFESDGGLYGALFLINQSRI